MILHHGARVQAGRLDFEVSTTAEMALCMTCREEVAWNVPGLGWTMVKTVKK